jgi:hypothetical protein
MSVDVDESVSMYLRVIPSFVLKLCMMDVFWNGTIALPVIQVQFPRRHQIQNAEMRDGRLVTLRYWLWDEQERVSKMQVGR